jgi:large subunit ribosomal protein L25
MAETLSLTAEPRTAGTKGAVRALRRQGRVPGIIYGGKEGIALVSFDGRELTKQLGSGSFMNRVIEVRMNGKSANVLPREVQLHPVKDAPLHIDFMRLEKGARVNVAVPVRFLNEGLSPGIKRGGVLNIVRHTIEVNTTVDNIPEVFTFDLTGLEIGDSLHISDITLPEGVKPLISDRDFTVATIAAPTAVRDEAAAEAEEAEAAEGEEAEEVEGEEAEAAEGEAEEGGESD